MSRAKKDAGKDKSDPKTITLDIEEFIRTRDSVCILHLLSSPRSILLLNLTADSTIALSARKAIKS